MVASSLLNKTPENTSLLQSTKFTFVFPLLPFARYFCQTISIPGVSTTAIDIPTPFASTFRHGSQLQYEDFQINAILDEDLRVWQETYNWIKSLTRPESYREYLKSYDPAAEMYQDAILTINTNANRPNVRFKFKNCHPTSLGAVRFNTSENADTIITADLTFRYDTFEIERIGG